MPGSRRLRGRHLFGSLIGVQQTPEPFKSTPRQDLTLPMRGAETPPRQRRHELVRAAQGLRSRPATARSNRCG